MVHPRRVGLRVPRYQHGPQTVEDKVHMVLPTGFEPAHVGMKSLCLNHLTTTAWSGFLL